MLSWTSVYLLIVGLGVVVMGVALVLAIRLAMLARGGVIGRAVKVLVGFIVLFWGAYVVAFWIPRLPPEAALLLVGMVFLLGAVFVVIVLSVIGRLVAQVFDELNGS